MHARSSPQCNYPTISFRKETQHRFSSQMQSGFLFVCLFALLRLPKKKLRGGVLLLIRHAYITFLNLSER